MEFEGSRDRIIIEDEAGQVKDYSLEGLFDIGEDSYALLSSNEEIIVMRFEEDDGEQYLVGIDDRDEQENILQAYELAIEAEPNNSDGGPH